PGWRLHPSCLPEQVRRPIGGGRIRFVDDMSRDATFPSAEVITDAGWQSLIEGRESVTLAPNTSVTVLWDLDQYHTAYPAVTLSGGAGSLFQIEWAESCYIPQEVSGKEHAKGNRDEIGGKVFRGYGDTFLPDGPRRTFLPFWWRAGRYVRIRVDTRDTALTIDNITLFETRLPLENESSFACSDAAFKPILDVSVRGIQMCAHETYMDCPYFEQLMYVGDTRLQMLTSYVMSAEDRLNQRGIALFDWSRRETGFVLERYPSDPLQLSATFAMIWVLMVRDHAWWRCETAFVKERLKGVRCLLEEFKAHLGDTDLLPALPGWSFMDWVPGLSAVNPPGPESSVSAVVNLLFIHALNAAADLETHFGELHLAAYNRDWATKLACAVQDSFWNADRGLFAEDPAHTSYSEHAQCLALLSGHFPELEVRCFEALITADDLLRTTVYFSFYLLETFQRFGRGDLIIQKLDFWKNMVAMGFKTPVEMPEPARSDCHAWGSHPLFHMHASLAGIRPETPGFKTVVIKPSPGTLREVHSSMPHPAGVIHLDLEAQSDGWQARISLPAGVEGQFVWAGAVYPLKGVQVLTLP
ncbi:MAG: alpha-L-rhamnosidase C-terminal domain-containing protein, partial [Kiritimatiellia bacterium]